MEKSPDAFRTISEVADWLGTPAHVLRFWESKFSQVKPVKRAGGRRYYRPGDMALLGGLKKLLHEDGMTIKGAQALLRERGVKHVANLSAPLDSAIETSAEEPVAQTPKPKPVIVRPGLPPQSLQPRDAPPLRTARDAQDRDHELDAESDDVTADEPAPAGPEETKTNDPQTALPFIHRPPKPSVETEPFLRSASRTLDMQSESHAAPVEQPQRFEMPPSGPPRLAALRRALMTTGAFEQQALSSVDKRLRSLRKRMTSDRSARPQR